MWHFNFFSTFFFICACTTTGLKIRKSILWQWSWGFFHYKSSGKIDPMYLFYTIFWITHGEEFFLFMSNVFSNIHEHMKWFLQEWLYFGVQMFVNHYSSIFMCLMLHQLVHKAIKKLIEQNLTKEIDLIIKNLSEKNHFQNHFYVNKYFMMTIFHIKKIYKKKSTFEIRNLSFMIRN